MSTPKRHYKPTKNIDMPRSGRSFGSFCPLKEMEVDESFTFPLSDQKRVEAQVHSYGSKNGAAFFINISEQEGTVWRTA